MKGVWKCCWRLPSEQYVRTSNLAERAFVEERRRTKVIPHLPDERSLVQLVFTVLSRVSDRTWERYVRNRKRLRQNQSLFARNPGVPRQETALLQGIVFCARYGRR
jgi:transposase-like protein